MPGDVFNGMGVLVEPLSNPDFLKVRETLTRVGSLSGDKQLDQTCFILHKRGQYAIMHHKEMQLMDGKNAEMTEEDRGHRNTVSYLLGQWGLVELQEPEAVKTPRADPGEVTVIPFKEKGNYSLKPLYEIGKPRHY